MSLDLARRVKGTRAPDFAILFLLSSREASNAETGVSEREREGKARDGWEGSEGGGRRGEEKVERTVGGEVGDASDGVALHLNVGREHLTDERIETSQSNDESLVLG